MKNKYINFLIIVSIIIFSCLYFFGFLAFDKLFGPKKLHSLCKDVLIERNGSMPDGVELNFYKNTQFYPFWKENIFFINGDLGPPDTFFIGYDYENFKTYWKCLDGQDFEHDTVFTCYIKNSSEEDQNCFAIKNQEKINYLE